MHICSLIIELFFATRLFIQLVSFPINLDLSAFCVNDEGAAQAAQAAQAAPTAAPTTSAYTLFAVLVHAGLLLYYPCFVLSVPLLFLSFKLKIFIH